MAVELIATALAAGAGVGVKDTAAVAIRNAYTGLKGLLDRRFAGRADASQALEADETEPGIWQARIGQDLVDTGAADDEQILAAARELLALADAAKGAAFHIKVDTNHGAVGNFNAPVLFNQGPPVPPASPVVR